MIIMIICAALGVNRRKYHGVSQLHPLDDKVLEVPALLTNGHAHGILYVRTSAGSSTIRNHTRNNKYRFYPQTIAEILAMARAHKEICTKITFQYPKK
jgi:hypothetical protein